MHVWEKFRARHHAETKTLKEWERDWRLWVLREHAPPTDKAQRPARKTGCFLDTKPAINATYEVIRNER